MTDLLKSLRAACLVTSAALATAPALAQPAPAMPPTADGYPSRPIEFMVSYPAGGGMDVTARILAQAFKRHTGHQVVVVNRAGANGAIGGAHISTQAKPDGYTVGIMASNFWLNTFLRSDGKWSYQMTDPVAFINYDSLAWIVRTDGPYAKASFKDLLERTRKEPGSVSVAATQTTVSGFLLDQVQRLTNTKFNAVQYQGGKHAVRDLLGGHIDVSFGFFAEYRSLLESGRVRAIGVTSTKPLPHLPGVPTFNEQIGVDNVTWDAFRFAVVPKETPPERRKWLEAAFSKVLSDPAVVEEFRKQGATVDRELDTAEKVAKEVERRAGQERKYLVETGRLPK